MIELGNYIRATEEIPDVYLINRPTIPDERGFFKETIRVRDLNNFLGIPFNFLQENQSRTGRNFLRGIHVAPWAKLFYCSRGEVQQVTVDLRPGSPTFLKWTSNIIGESNRSMIYVPAGCGNSFLALSGDADCVYKVDEEWAQGKEYGVAFDDPDLKIEWLVKNPQLSPKDQQNRKLKEIFPEYFS